MIKIKRMSTDQGVNYWRQILTRDDDSANNPMLNLDWHLLNGRNGDGDMVEFRSGVMTD